MVNFIMRSPTVAVYLFQLPYYVVWLVGISLCLSRWQRYPKVCAVALAGISLMFLESLLGTLLSYHLLPRMFDGAYGRDIRIHYLIWGVRALIHAGLWGFILAAIFGWRGTGRAGSAERALHPGD